MTTTVSRACNLCEAGCGLVFEVDDERIVSVRPDADDPASQGYVCPKGMAIAEIHDDPDRLRRPVQRQPDGSFREISWERAFDLVGSRLRAIRAEHGADAISLYFGNPLVHNASGVLMVSSLVDAIGTRNRTSAGSQDTSPRFAASYYLYGNTLVVPVPDLERTDYFLCIGANPVVSQGSSMVTPDVKTRIREIGARGGKVVTVDPRRTETAKLADEHVFIKPGGDTAFLLAMLSVLVAEDRIDAAVLAAETVGWDTVRDLLAEFTPERAERASGVAAATVRRLALEFADASAGVVYTRIGVCNSRYGTLASWANDVLNIATGRLGRAGGAMFADPTLDLAQVAELTGMNGHGRWTSRVRGLPETGCDLPASILAEEIETPGQGQIRAMISIAGNPVLSTPNGRRLDRAMETLDFYVAVDLYVNETTRHADVILPPCWALAESHTEPLTPSFSLRSGMRWSPPVVSKPEDELSDWQIMLRLTEEMGGGPTGKKWLDAGLGLAAMAGWNFDPDQALDLLVRLGTHGDRFLPWSGGLNRAKIVAAPHGVDLGRAREGVAHRIFHKDRRVHLDGAPIVDALTEYAAEFDRAAVDEVLLVGRRDLRSNNSWMHNAPSLVAGRDRCVLYVHPIDAERAGLRDSRPATLASRVHSAEVPVRVTDEVMPGVVSLPHGWGHAASAPWQSVASAHAGVSANDWTDDQDVERVVGQSILNGVSVRLSAAE